MSKRLHDNAFQEEDENPKDERELVVGSLDFKAWYQSFNPIESGNIVRKRLETSLANIKVDDLDNLDF